MKEQYQVPVAVFVFKRVELAKKMLKCLEQIRPTKLFVISDGPRRGVTGEQEQVEQVRALFNQVSWPCEIKRNYARENMGCDVRVPSGISWVFEQVEEAVILEDDCHQPGRFRRSPHDGGRFQQHDELSDERQFLLYGESLYVGMGNLETCLGTLYW